MPNLYVRKFIFLISYSTVIIFFIKKITDKEWPKFAAIENDLYVDKIKLPDFPNILETCNKVDMITFPFAFLLLLNLELPNMKKKR